MFCSVWPSRGCKIWQQYFTTPKSPIVRSVKYDCHIMHPLKDQREGVKYGRGVKYGVTPVSQRVSDLAWTKAKSGAKI